MSDPNEKKDITKTYYCCDPRSMGCQGIVRYQTTDLIGLPWRCENCDAGWTWMHSLTEVKGVSVPQWKISGVFVELKIGDRVRINGQEFFIAEMTERLNERPTAILKHVSEFLEVRRMTAKPCDKHIEFDGTCSLCNFQDPEEFSR